MINPEVSALVDVTIINYDQNKLLEKCAASILNSENAGNLLSSLIVRNTGNPYAPSFPAVVINGGNVGYGAACNECARLCGAPYLLFLNSDLILKKDALHIAFRLMESRSDCGICGISLEYENGLAQPSKMAFPTAKDLLERTTSRNRGYALFDQMQTGTADWVLGAFLLVRREAFESVGGFDETFFLYFEEVDLAMRMKAASWKCLYSAEARAVHFCGCAGGVSSFCLRHSARSRLVYAHRYFSRKDYAAIRRRTLFVEPALRFGNALITGQNPFGAFMAPIKGAALAKKR